MQIAPLAAEPPATDPRSSCVEVEPFGWESSADNQQLRDLFEFAREEIVTGTVNETSAEMAGNSLDESDQALSLQFIDEELARLAACAPEG